MNAPQPTEHQIQARFLKYLEANGRQELTWFAVPNGGLRNARVAYQMKAEGVMPGVADLVFMLDHGKTAFLEMKTPTGSLSDAQKGFRSRCERTAHTYAIAKSVEEAIEIVKAWGVLK